MLIKTVKCKDITFETLEDILNYKRNEVDHTWHISLECIDEIKNFLKDYEIYKVEKEEKEELNTVNAVLNGLEEIDEEKKIMDNAVKMNSLLQSEPLTTSVVDDIEDEAQLMFEQNKNEELPETTVSGEDGYSF